MAKKSRKRDMATITRLIAEVESMREKDPKLSIQAACNSVGLRKETYYARLRADEANNEGSSDLKQISSTPIESIPTETLMKEFIALEKRMEIVKKELYSRMKN